MNDRYDKILTWILMTGFVLGFILGIYQFVQVLHAPVVLNGLFDDYPKIDLLSVIAYFTVLTVACLVALIFPAGKYWKYVSVGLGGLGLILCYLMGLDFYTGERYTITHSGILWTTVYLLLLWNLWGMFIPYLEKRLRRLWLWGYPAGCLLMYLINLIPSPNY